MDRGYFENLASEALIDMACRLRDFSVDLVERLEQNSQNSSRPPSSDSPYDKGTGKESESEEDDKEVLRAFPWLTKLLFCDHEFRPQSIQ